MQQPVCLSSLAGLTQGHFREFRETACSPAGHNSDLWRSCLFFMTPYDDQTKLCIACLATIDGVGPVTIRKLLSAASGEASELLRFMRLSNYALQREFGLSASVARAIAAIDDPTAKGQAVCRRVIAAGGRPVFDGEPEYPSRLSAVLRTEAPVVLVVRGEPGILQALGVAIVGSRRPSHAARRAAEEMSACLSDAGYTVVSGGARGIDSTAHEGALRNGATAILPATGILRFRLRKRRISLPSGGSCCVLGHFAPDARWRTVQALGRNRLIVALGNAVVAFEPRDTGGTWHSSTQALKLGVPLFVVCGSDAQTKQQGLRRLVCSGATALDPERMPDADAFAALVAEKGRETRPAQSEMFETDGASE